MIPCTNILYNILHCPSIPYPYLPLSYHSVFLDREVSLVSLNDGKWRHVCLTWNNVAGTWNLYLDGALRGSGRSLGTGLSIHGSGRLVLGQDRDNIAKSFIGNITQFNLWDHVFEQATIKNMSGYCYRNQSLGNVLFWSEFRMKFNGQVQIESRSSCNTTGK